MVFKTELNNQTLNSTNTFLNLHSLFDQKPYKKAWASSQGLYSVLLHHGIKPHYLRTPASNTSTFSSFSL